MITIDNLSKNYGELQVLNNVSLDIESGDIYGLIGRSGAGKSTLLRCINGLESFQNGTLRIEGVEVNSLHGKQLREFRKNIGMIFQHFSLLERKTVYENIALPMKCWKVPKKEIDKRIKELVKIVDIESKLNVKAKYLSGGQKQRVAIARALALNPKILLCDEATSALDPRTTNDILNLLRKINQELNITIIVVTHQMSVVQQVCNRVSILENGDIVEKGLVGELFLKQPLALKRLLGDEFNRLPSKGLNLQVVLTDDKENYKFVSKMALDLGVTFSIVGGSVEQYRDGKYSKFIINAEEQHKEIIIAYLKKNNYVYNVLENNIDKEVI